MTTGSNQGIFRISKFGNGLLSAIAMFCLAASFAPANAGDFAERRALGFSGDGRYFAFEQFGVQDGSGFPYADIFVIDIEADQWVPDTPVRVLLKDEQAGLTSARDKAASQAAPILQNLAISQPGRLLASNPPAEIGDDPHRVSVNTRYELQGGYRPRLYTLSEMQLPAPKICSNVSDAPMKGFRLQSQVSGSPPVTLHEDKSLPESRGCPLAYAISDVFGFRRPDGREVFAILIRNSRVGFEGPDRRFLAVTQGLD